MNKKKIAFVLFSSILIFMSVVAVSSIDGNIQERQSELAKLDREISIARQNYRQLINYLKFKKRFGGGIPGIRIQPVNITANFSSLSQAKKINSIINSTYSGEGYFFLEDLSIDREENENKKPCSLVFTLKGKKVVMFVR